MIPYDGFFYEIDQPSRNQTVYEVKIYDSSQSGILHRETRSNWSYSGAENYAKMWIDTQNSGDNGEIEYDDLEDHDQIEDQDQIEEEYTPPVVPIDPSDDGDVISIIQDYSEEEFVWQEVQIPNFNASPSPFQTLTSAGNVDIDEDSLYAESDEDNSSEFFIRIKDGTKVTMSVKLAYSNKTIDRKYVRPNDWSEEFDLVLEGGDSIRWNVPDQPKGSTNPLTLGKIDNPREGNLSIIVADQERIDQNTGVFITYFEKKTGDWLAYAKGEIGMELKIEKYEIAVSRIPEGGSDSGSDMVIVEDEELFDTTDILLGFAVMGILAMYLYSISYNPVAEGE